MRFSFRSNVTLSVFCSVSVTALGITYSAARITVRPMLTDLDYCSRLENYPIIPEVIERLWRMHPSLCLAWLPENLSQASYGKKMVKFSTRATSAK